MQRKYQICTKCIMDTTDPDIQFDKNGVCNHCKRYDEKVRQGLFSDEAGRQNLQKLVEEIKNKGKNKKYDCIVGVSGGVDSTYVAYLTKKLGLKPLAVHFDNGWNSELAVSNIEKILKQLGIDLYTYVVNWGEFKDLQLAFLKASVPDAEIPTDHGISAILYEIAIKMGVQFIFTGVNLSTEGIHPIKWSYGLWDWKYIKDVHKKFGVIVLKNYPYYTLLDLSSYVFIKKFKRIPLLNYETYNKQETKKFLTEKFGWRDYGGKHYESIYTRFFQGYILPKKFNFDKRRAHLSTLICSGQIKREEALVEMKYPSYSDEKMMTEDRDYVIKKLDLTEAEFEEIMKKPIKTVKNYRSNYWLFFVMRWLSRKLKIFKFI